MEDRISALLWNNTFKPLGWCQFWHSDLLWLQSLAHISLALVFTILGYMIARYLWFRKSVHRYHKRIASLFVIFLVLCSLTSVAHLVTLFVPIYGILALLEIATTIVAVITVALTWPLLPTFINMPSHRLLSELNSQLKYEITQRENAFSKLEQEQIRLSSELTGTLQRYQLAMKSSKLVIFTLNEKLEYISVSGSLFGFSPDELINHTDDDVLPPATCNILAPVKKRVIKQGQPEQIELPITHNNTTRWYEISLTPLRDYHAKVIGLTCASLDTTERKLWEQHLRLLMREVTHRSKNLLAVIQAMARQTARQADSLDGFIERFSSRLQALGGAHDLLVQESWHGVNLHDLIQSQMGPYIDLIGTRITLNGPMLYLSPEAAQNLGMALHEMTTNAAKYGALSTTKGQVNIIWQWVDDNEAAPSPENRKLHLQWAETGGPPAKQPSQYGFGTHVIERNVTRSMAAKVSLSYAPEGFIADMMIPASQLLSKQLPLEAQIQLS